MRDLDRIDQAADQGELTVREAELLAGFVALERWADRPSRVPLRSWERRLGLLRSLGLGTDGYTPPRSA